jgi:uncharacterized repeat protein (TIGR01451 family)
VKANGTLACWGNNGYGRATPADGTFTQVSGGEEHTCGLRTDGTGACWGRDNYGQATPPVGGTFTQVSAGWAHTCWLVTGGMVVCGGLSDYGQASPPGWPLPSGTFTQVSAGGKHTCGLKTDGTVACWGAGTPGFSGDPHYGQASPPGGAFTQVSAGDDHTCGLKTDGTVACWGNDDYGQASPPVGVTFTQVSAGGGHTCGVKTDGILVCWGHNGWGQAATITVDPASLPDGQGGVAYSQSLIASGGTAPYSLAVVAGSLPPGLSLNSTTGLLSGTPASGGDYTFTIQATDVNFFQGERAYTITIPNRAPTDISLSNNSVAENQPSGTAVGDLTTTDPDTLDAHTYSLEATGGCAGFGSDNGAFAIAGGQLRTAAAFDYEAKSSYDICVRTDDGNGGTYDEPFTVNVVDVNEWPTDISLSNNSVAENQPGGTAVGDLTTTDPDTLDTHTYSLETTSGCADFGSDNGTFTIAGSQLQTAAVFDYETKSSYDICVRANDGQGGTYDEPFTIDVTDANDAPTDISLSNNSVAENQPSGTVVGDFATADQDVGGSHTYSLVGTGTYPDNAFFAIAGSQLRTAAVFDYETKSSYTIQVRTDDGSGGTYDEVFVINVIDANDAPAAVDDGYSTNEDTPLNAVAPGVLGNDNDEDGHPLTAVLFSGPGNGTLTLNANGSFTYTPAMHFNGVDTFVYYASDVAASSNPATVSIAVGVVGGLPDVTIVKTVSPTIAFPGQTVVYTLAYSNTGSAPATDVVITDMMPDGVVVLGIDMQSAADSTAASGADVSDAGVIPGSFMWQVRDLAPKERRVIVIRARLDLAIVAPATLTNTAEIAAAVDSNPGSNRSAAAVTVPGFFRSVVPGGAWHTGTTWEAGSVPGPGDVVTITANSTVTVDADAQCYRLFVEEGGVLVIPAGVTLSVVDGVTSQGRMQQTVDGVGAGATTRFLHIQNPAGDRDTYLGVDVTPQGDMGTVTVAVRGQQTCGGVGNGDAVLRCYEIDPATEAAATVTFYYRAAEGNGNTSPQAHHWNGNAWDALPSTNGGGGDALWVQATVADYSPFALADSGNAPMSITLLSFRAAARRIPHWAGGLMGVVLLCIGVWVRRRRRFT